MKRFVYIPDGMITNGEIPQEALTLSKEAQLSIREGSVGDGVKTKEISIVSFPEVNIVECQEYSYVNFVHIIDITNEFISFSINTFLEVISDDGSKEIFKPNLKEKHLVRFRPRFTTKGKKYFCVYSGNEKIHSGEFEVK